VRLKRWVAAAFAVAAGGCDKTIDVSGTVPPIDRGRAGVRVELSCPDEPRHNTETASNADGHFWFPTLVGCLSKTCVVIMHGAQRREFPVSEWCTKTRFFCGDECNEVVVSPGE
jgi:hypothetical protein